MIKWDKDNVLRAQPAAPPTAAFNPEPGVVPAGAATIICPFCFTSYSTFSQVVSGLKSFIARAVFFEFSPKSFW